MNYKLPIRPKTNPKLKFSFIKIAHRPTEKHDFGVETRIPYNSQKLVQCYLTLV